MVQNGPSPQGALNRDRLFILALNQSEGSRPRKYLRPPVDPPNCEKCGQPSTLLIVIQRLGDEPGYRIFHCEACNVLQWVPEKIVGGDKSG
jgi:hypothetical protein